MLSPGLFWYCKTTNLLHKIVITPRPPLVQKNLDKGCFWYSEGFPYESFGCETKQFSWEVLTTPASLILNILRYQKFRNSEGLPYIFFRYCETTNLRGRNVTNSGPTPIHKNLRHQKFSKSQKSYPTNIFGTLKPKIFDGTSW